MKKIIAIFLSVITLCTVALPFYVYANVGVLSDNASLLQEGNYDFYFTDEESGKVVDNASLNVEGFTKKVITGLTNVSSNITNLLSYNISTTDFKVIYSNIINDNPDLFYVSSSYTYYFDKDSDCITSILPRYALTKSEVASAKLVFNQGVQKALSVVDDSMTNVQKALVIHDFLCSIARYPHDYNSEMLHSAYGIFYNGDTVCAGYSLAYSYLMHYLDIPCYYVSSPSMQHAWNAVYVDDAWYYVDLTYDDIGYFGEYNTYGAMHHRCFLKSEQMFRQEYCFLHYDMLTPEEVVCDSTKYDDYFWNDVDTNIEVVNGKYYYPKLNLSTRYAKFETRDVEGNSLSLSNTSFKFTYSSLTSKSEDENKVEHEIDFYEPFVRLKYADDKFYLSAYDSLYSISDKGKTYKIYSSGKSSVSSADMIIGMDMIDSNISIQKYKAIATPLVLDKLEYFKSYFGSKNDYNNYADVDNNEYINAIDYLLITR